MNKIKRFTFRLNESEQLLLNDLAVRLERNRSDAIRFLIRNSKQFLENKGVRPLSNHKADLEGVGNDKSTTE